MGILAKLQKPVLSVSRHSVCKLKKLEETLGVKLLERTNRSVLLDEDHCMREQVVSFCRRDNAMETQNFRATSLEALRHMVAAGAGISLLPKLASEGCDLATFIPFSGVKPMRSIGLVWRTATSKSVLLKEIDKEIKMLMEKKKMVNVPK